LTPREELVVLRRIARESRALVSAIGVEAVERARETAANVPGSGGQHYIGNGRLVRIADALTRLDGAA
jgi:hypothetical protein